ncbi:hypothetical protein IWQ55_006171 [Labrenzia sp. EL_208]|nr:hypothetical protein [Labrenzia sp. EL_132]MBG6211564.1 hypothetical protein [Labrenzia sp. EL_126]MBG6232937.1 hypothetical protein [Labrenzia sp. EL_208]
MSEAKKDTKRALVAAKAILDDRDTGHAAGIMVTLEHTVAGILLLLYPHDVAARMLNEGLVQGVEKRIAMHQAKKKP